MAYLGASPYTNSPEDSGLYTLRRKKPPVQASQVVQNTPPPDTTQPLPSSSETAQSNPQNNWIADAMKMVQGFTGTQAGAQPEQSPPTQTAQSGLDTPLVNMPAAAEEQPVNNDPYADWKKPVFGMPLDKFVQLAGMGAAAFAPKEWSGRMGAGLANMAGEAERDRIAYEANEPYRNLMMRRAEAEIANQPLNTLSKQVDTVSKLEALQSAGKKQELAETEEENRPYYTEAMNRFLQEGNLAEAQTYAQGAGVKPNEVVNMYETLHPQEKPYKPLTREDALADFEAKEKIKKKYEKSSAADKPEYKPGQALKRLSSIETAIARLQSGSPFDQILALQLPEYAGIIGSKDPAVMNQAISQLKDEADYVRQFVPKKPQPGIEIGVAHKNAGNAADKQIVRTGKDKSGKKVVQYSDGSIAYAE